MKIYLLTFDPPPIPHPPSPLQLLRTPREGPACRGSWVTVTWRHIRFWPHCFFVVNGKSVLLIVSQYLIFFQNSCKKVLISQCVNSSYKGQAWDIYLSWCKCWILHKLLLHFNWFIVFWFKKKIAKMLASLIFLCFLH